MTALKHSQGPHRTGAGAPTLFMKNLGPLPLHVTCKSFHNISLLALVHHEIKKIISYILMSVYVGVISFPLLIGPLFLWWGNLFILNYNSTSMVSVTSASS